jgi:ankyrin repeat protein
VITLIEYNASTNGMGHKLLSLALMQKNLEAAQYLVDKGVNINGIGQDRPIDTAIFSEDLENVKFMVAQKADLTNTLSKCIKNNLKEIGEYLALNGAPWDTKEYNGFHYMTEKVGRFTILKSLKTSGTDTIKKIENYLKLQDSQDITQKIIDENSPKDVLKIFNLLKINCYRLKPVVWPTLAKQIKSVNARILIS